MEGEHKEQLNDVNSKLHDKTNEASTLRLDVEKLRVSSLELSSGSMHYSPYCLRVHFSQFI